MLTFMLYVVLMFEVIMRFAWIALIVIFLLIAGVAYVVSLVKGST